MLVRVGLGGDVGLPRHEQGDQQVVRRLHDHLRRRPDQGRYRRFGHEEVTEPLDPTAPIVIEGAQPSADVRAELARQGRPVLLAFSRGKDSIAAWLALRDAGVDVRPFHLYLVPGFTFVEESLAEYERYFGCEIPQLPEPDYVEIRQAARRCCRSASCARFPARRVARRAPSGPGQHAPLGGGVRRAARGVGG